MEGLGVVEGPWMMEGAEMMAGRWRWWGRGDGGAVAMVGLW